MKSRLAGGIAALVATAAVAGAAAAQTRSVRDTATAYGARLNARGAPANSNPNRISNRVDNRINGRVALRIERYRPDSTENPTAAFATPQDDRSRITPVITPAAPTDDP